MSKVQFSIVRVSNPGTPAAPLASSKALVTPQVISTTSSAQETTLQPEDATGWIASQATSFAWRVAVKGSDDVVVAFGSAPTAVADGSAGYYCIAGGVYEFAVDQGTDIASVINAT